MNIGHTADQFKNRLLGNIKSYSPTVTLQTLDINGNPTSVEENIRGYLYTIVIDRYRGDIDLPQSDATDIVAFGDKAKSLTVKRTQDHSDPLTGTYQIRVGGTPITINEDADFEYDSTNYHIAVALRNRYDEDQIEVFSVASTYKDMDIKFIIYYYGLR